MIRELNHVGIRVADLDASLRLYRDILGGVVIKDAQTADGAMRVVYVQLANGVVELISNKTGGDFGLHHIAFLLADGVDIKQAAERVRSAGYEISVEPKPATTAGFHCFFTDAGGCVYELIQREDSFRIDGLENEHIKCLDHVSIRVDNTTVGNVDALLKDVLEMDEGRKMEIGPYLWHSRRIGADSIGLFNTLEQARPDKTLALLVFDVENTFDMHRHLTENGIEVTEPRAAGIGDFHLIFATGPDGEKLEFLDR